MHQDSNKKFSAKHNSWHFISFTHQMVALETSKKKQTAYTMDFESSQKLEPGKTQRSCLTPAQLP